jgi:glycosyltransferase involved in cell wall biosynthesis
MIHQAFGALLERMDIEVLRSDDLKTSLPDRVAARFGSRGEWPDPLWAPAITSMLHGKELTRRLETMNVDVVVALFASRSVAYLGDRVPILSVSDSTFRKAWELRGTPVKASDLFRRETEFLERRSWRRSARCLITSRWAEQSLVNDYGIAEERCMVIPFGPGVVPPQPQPGRAAPGSRPRILAVIRDWERKQGRVVLEAFKLIREDGLDAELTVVGRSSPPEPHEGPITWLGELDSEQLAAVYREHDVVVDLAKANCASVVLSDATAWALPVVATDIGAAREMVDHGQTGLLVALDEDTAANAARGITTILAPQTYERTSQACSDRARTSGRWDLWGQSVLAAAEDAIRDRSGRRQ